MMRRRVAAMVLALTACGAADAAAQLDPLLYLKKNKPNILLAVETAHRMQRDIYNDYLDPNVYVRTGVEWELALGVPVTATTYRRKFVALAHRDQSTSADDKFETSYIQVIPNTDATGVFGTFDARTRLAIARRALAQAVASNSEVAAFRLFKTRQQNPRLESGTPAEATNPPGWNINEGPVRVVSDVMPLQKITGELGSNKWRITRPVVDRPNSDLSSLTAAMATTNADVLAILNRATGAAGGISLIPGGRDARNIVDAPLDYMLDDLRNQAEQLFAADPDCANTVAVLVVGGGQGTTTTGDPVAKASQFLNISGRRVPIHVIGVGVVTATERTQLRNVAAASGGQYTDIDGPMFESAGAGNAIPEIVRAVNFAVSHGFANAGDLNRAPDAGNPLGFFTEHQVTSPIVGTVNLEGARDITGTALPDTVITHPITKTKIPQRSNVLVTTGFSLPGFDGKLRAFRVYRPIKDDSKHVGYRFSSDGTRLWVASAPEAASRNIYTALPDGTAVAFTALNAAVLQPYLRTPDLSSTVRLIEFVRSQPLGAIVGSTPAIMDPPSLDPPPDSAYPQFVDDHKNRRTIIWVGANDGMLHAIDGRLGKEVWAFVPFNLLPKLRSLQAGQPAGDFRFYVDGSPKVADVKVDGKWRSYLVVGEGAGGTFYQTFDVTLDNIASTVSPDSDSLSAVLSYFASPTAVRLRWAFPSYSHFDVNLGTWGDIAASAPAISKTVGETWSDPAVGQVETSAGRFVVLTGSGFFRYSVQQQTNRNGIVAGTTFYVLDVRDGKVLDSRDVGNDGRAEDVDNCAAPAVNDCRRLKNALHADPVATGPADSRFITKAYIGDLDGRIWRFDIGLNGAGVPVIKQLVNLYTVDATVGPAHEHPMFASMATVNVGTTQQYLFIGTGSDLLPQNQVNTAYALLVVRDNGPSGTRTGMVRLETTDGVLGDEKVSAFPAVAGDIVFFSTTTYRAGGCSVPSANLYAFTFIGGPAYDTNNDGRITTGASGDSPRVQTVSGARATAPFIVDQHLVFGTGGNVEMFGDPNDFNNGVGQAGVRILSWREVR